MLAGATRPGSGLWGPLDGQGELLLDPDGRLGIAVVGEVAGGLGTARRPAVPGKVDARHLVRAMQAPLRQAQRAARDGGPAPVAEHVWHLALRNADADRHLSDREWAQVAADVMDATGIAPRGPDGEPAAGGCPWIAVRHDDTSIHLMAVLAREDGRAVRLWQDYPKVRAACLAAEARYGLISTAPADRTAATHTTRAEREKATRLAGAPRSGASTGAPGRAGSGEPAREQLRRHVRAAAAASSNAEQFLAALLGGRHAGART